MRIRTLAVNILLPASIAVAIVAAWIWTTGSFRVSAPTAVGLALTAAGVAAIAEPLLRSAVKAVRRRSRPARHRKEAL